MYAILPDMSSVRRIADGAIIPNDPNNADRQVFADWVASGGVAEPYVSPAIDLRAYVAEKRWRVEVGGVPFGALRLPSDDRAKTLIMGAAGAMSDAATAPFVVGSSVVTLTGAQFKAAHQAIVAHVQACFATQVAVLAAIDAGTITTTAQIDAAAWPANS